ncbi:MAG: large conductance mechanosensitive channel protein MscL [Clostridia bacterium]|nr:large conductance mechanosensitive channel protein MscL [Clostridia bacterium]
MKKLLKEFKAFITRGNVVDLAVGMIIGAAFTAIVAALVSHIFQPLINWIPMGNLSGLITMLEPRNAEGIKCALADADLTKSIYIDWGAFIMAIINFLLTAVVLFGLVKIINTLRGGAGGLKKDAEFMKSITEEEKAKFGPKLNRKALKAIKAAREEEAARKAEEEKKAKEEEEANKESVEDLLKDIRALLQAQNK